MCGSLGQGCLTLNIWKKSKGEEEKVIKYFLTL
jgi:hypothetical protein